MAVREYVDVIPGLWSMGADYIYDGSVSLQDLDPEMTVLRTLKHYWTANDVFFMLFALLKFRIGSFIHVERLVRLSKTGFLSNDELILLMAVSKKLVEGGDHRFKAVYKHLYKKGMKLQTLPRLHGRKSLVKAHGAEESLLEFGAEVRKFEVDDRKLHVLSRIVERNSWLKLRALMGVNYRADVTFLKCTGQAEKPAQVAQILGCDSSTASKNLKYIDEFKNLKKILSVS